jgi:hypothetical protein
MSLFDEGAVAEGPTGGLPVPFRKTAKALASSLTRASREG